MNYRKLTPSKHIRAADLDGKEHTVKITGIVMADVESDDGAKTRKGVFQLEGTPKTWVANVTNATALKHMFGSDTDGWIGKRVTIYPQPDAKHEMVIRVRGSPDIKASVTYTLKLAKKRPQQVTLVPTGPKPNGKPAAPPPAPPAQAAPSPFESEPTVSEPPDDVPLPGDEDYRGTPEAQS